MSRQRSAVLIKVTDDALIVANDGKRVSRLGVLALCALDLSEKTGSEDELPEDYPDIPDSELLRAIADRSIAVYRVDANRLKRDLRHERGVVADYGGRYLWELLQNADDALADDSAEAAELIGTKGLGFISVLEVTERPEIFSRPFSFHFSRSDTEALLLSQLGKRIAGPTFEIPHAAVESPLIASLLQDGYATAIRLPFRNAEAACKVREDVGRLDHRFLLLLQHITRLRIEVSGLASRSIEVDRSVMAAERERIALYVRVANGRPHVGRWAKWSRQWQSEGEDKRLSVAVCLPLDEAAVAVALQENDKPPVHMFFPTDETVGARAIVHASLDVTENRKHFRESQRNDLVYPRMRELVAEIVAAIPASSSLDAFGCVDPKSTSGAARILASTILDAVKETPFVPTIGGDKVRPRDVVVWKGDFGKVLRQEAPGLKNYRFLHPSVIGRNSVLQAMQAKAIGPHDFFGAMRHCRNGSPAECERAVDVLLQEGVPMLDAYPYYAWLEQVPCWWTEAGLARSIAGGILLFSRPRSWPKSVPADALSTEAHSHLETIEKALSGNVSAKHMHSVWREHVVKQFVHEGEYLERALLPAMEKMKAAEWDKHGWEILRWYRDWSEKPRFEVVSPMPIVHDRELGEGDIFRRRLSRALRLPTDKGWRAAEQCYASMAWGAPRSFRAFFEKVGDRAVVRPLRSWQEPLRTRADLDTWKGLLRFAGVAWEPKMVTAGLGDVTREYADLHLGDFNRSDFDVRIEYFPECLATENRLLPLLDAGRTMWTTAQRLPAKYLAYNKQKPQTLKTNFARHQLEFTKWLPHKKSLLFPEGTVAGSDAYLAGKGIEGLLPEIALPDVELRRKNDLLRFLRAIGIKESLPTDGFAWIGWMQRLADASDQASANKPMLFEVARTLYRRLFESKIEDLYPSLRLRLPCFVGGDDREHLGFVRAQQAQWLDQAIFEAPDIRRALLAHGYRIFILFMNQADRADERLGLGRLSEAVTLVPVSAGVDDEGSAFAGELYRSRIRALRAVVPDMHRSLLKEDLRIEATPGLSISMRSEDGNEIATTEVRAFRNRHGTLMIVGDGAYHRSLGLGLAHYLVGQPRHTAIFENILSAANEQEVIERLRDQGVPEQELEAVHAEMSKEDAAHASRSNDVTAGDETRVDRGTDATSPSSDKPSVTTSPSYVRSRPAEPSPTFPTPTDNSIGPRSGPSGSTNATAGRQTIQVQRLGTQTWTSRGAGIGDPSLTSQAGRHAEDWLHARLTVAFPGRPITRNELDDERRESDFVIRLDRRTIHIEVKRLGTMPGYIYWSDLEFRKCEALGDDYCMAVLLPSQDEYSVAWIWRPIDELADAERFVDWIWNERRSDQLPDGDWQPTSPPSMPARGFTYRIFLAQAFVDSLPKDAADLTLLKSRSV
ncbi:hypothetical protein ACQR1H_31385 [Bradyrhizobium sp. HKCCYLRH2015]|uniref:hypothetical protein n=1 Tax=Bradyrhizobium sp. HKCCYLRH2015 TaxID=3420742 RepID=UPI003EBA8992